MNKVYLIVIVLLVILLLSALPGATTADNRFRCPTPNDAPTRFYTPYPTPYITPPPIGSGSTLTPTRRK